MTTILIARHGNTFEPGQQVVRVGLKTDLPLAVAGLQQAKNIGNYLQRNQINLGAVFTSTLKRTIQTAKLALQVADLELPITQLQIFDEIDYGPDEGKPENEVIDRIGKAAIDAWEQQAIVPPGWLINADEIISNWQSFAQEITALWPNQTVLVVTSNGIARFAPYIADFAKFNANNTIKLATGALGSLTNIDGKWEVDFWNLRPEG